MIHKDVEYTVTPAAPGIWKWQFRIGDRVVAGKTETKLNCCHRRVQLRIDRELKKTRGGIPARFPNCALSAAWFLTMTIRLHGRTARLGSIEVGSRQSSLTNSSPRWRAAAS